MREHDVSILNAFGKYLRDKFELKRMESESILIPILQKKAKEFMPGRVTPYANSIYFE